MRPCRFPSPGSPAVSVAPPLAPVTARSVDRRTTVTEGKNAYAAKDYVRARAFYEKAGTTGHANDCTTLGNMLSAGQGTPQDKATARALYDRACTEGRRHRLILRTAAILLAVIAVSVLLAYPTTAQGMGMKRGSANKGGSGGMGLGGRVGGRGGGGGGKQNVWDPVEFYFPGYDVNGDGHLDEAEWKRRGNFKRLDANRNSTIEPSEFRALYEDWGRLGPMTNPILPSTTQEIDPTVQTDRISFEEVGKQAACAVVRLGVLGIFKCSNGDQIATRYGLFETGIGPVFPTGAICHGIDEIYAMDYTNKTGKGMHGGIDLPSDFGTPVLAVAAGTVVGKFDPDRNARGKTIVLRHNPADTGLPFWVFTEYAHMDELPKQEIGQRVRMGEVLGPTGNSGISVKNKSRVNRRRPGLHFAVYYSDSPRFAEVPGYIVPENVRWMDSNALYRSRPPYDSGSVRSLPDDEKDIPIPIMYLDGAIERADTRLIWPYACKRD